MSSRQLQKYLELRRGGAGMMTAAAEAGLGIEEARFTENAMARGELAAAESPPPKENEMGRPKKATVSNEVGEPDFEKAVLIYRQDIKPAVEGAGEKAQEASTGYKAIKKECGVNTRAARFVFSLERESEEKRNDVLRSLRGMLGAMNIGITDDLVSRAEGDDPSPPIPTAKATRPQLATVN